MSRYLKVSALINELKKHDPDAVVMVAMDEDNTFEASDVLTPAFLSSDGEIFTIDEMRDDDSPSTLMKALVIWSN